MGTTVSFCKLSFAGILSVCGGNLTSATVWTDILRHAKEEMTCMEVLCSCALLKKIEDIWEEDVGKGSYCNAQMKI